MRVIFDGGANVGITALYFAWRYPNARIFCIEPDNQNFELLKRDTAAEPRIVAIRGALVGAPVSLCNSQPIDRLGAISSLTPKSGIVFRPSP